MKKIFIMMLAGIFAFGGAQAQTKDASVGAISKEEKAAAKEVKQAAKDKKEADLVSAFKKAGLSSAEQIKARAILDASNEKTKPIKADDSLSDEAKKEKLDAIYHDRNEEMKALLGKEKYKAFKDEQKAQKEAGGG